MGVPEFHPLDRSRPVHAARKPDQWRPLHHPDWCHRGVVWENQSDSGARGRRVGVLVPAVGWLAYPEDEQKITVYKAAGVERWRGDLTVPKGH